MSPNPSAGAELPPISLRAVGADDALFLRDLHHRRVAAELAAGGLPSAQLEAVLDLQYTARERAFEALGVDDAIVLAHDERVGRVVIRRDAAAVRLVDVEVLPEHRGRGIGAAVVAAVVDEARTTGRVVQLTVLRHSPARRLYERQGLVVVGAEGAHVSMEWNGATC